MLWALRPVVQRLPLCSGPAAGCGARCLHNNTSVLDSYNRLVAEGKLQPDSSQAAAAQALQLLQDAFLQQAAVPGRPAGGVDDDAASAPAAGLPAASPAATGAYLWGPVGSGKTMLADLFCSTLPAFFAAEQPVRVQRTHFHAFMQRVHLRQHRLQQEAPRTVVKSRTGLPVHRFAPLAHDPLLTIADEIAAQHHLLCLDELHVTDVADAMVLSRLFGALLVRGCWLLLTSNRPAGLLYEGGLSRKYFEPFIALLQRHLLQLNVASGMDYRERPEAAQPARPTHLRQQQTPADAAAAAARAAPTAWLVGPDAGQRLQRMWRQHLEAAGCEPAAVRLPLRFGRSLYVPCAAVPALGGAAGGTSAAALFGFEQLCGRFGCSEDPSIPRPLSAADYVVLAQSFQRLFIRGIPQLRQRDDARRFVTLVDVLYDAGCKVVAEAAVPPEDLFLPLLAAAYTQGADPALGAARDAAALVTKVQAHLSTSAVQRPAAAQQGHSMLLQEVPHALYAEEVLMYRRAASRLLEMGRQ